MEKENLTLIIKTPAGCENLLLNELTELGYTQILPLTRAVSLSGTWEDVYRINYASRFALSVLVSLTHFTVNDYNDIYKGALQLHWTHFLSVNDTFLIKHTITSPEFTHSQMCALKVKDAIADYFSKRENKRPSVSKEHPDIIFHIHIRDNKAQILLDTSGLPLYRRGYKRYQGIAPLNEILAAALVKWSGFTANKKLIDLFAGSGTILCEAFLQAINRPAGFYRSNYAFMRFKNFDRALWEHVRSVENKKENIVEVDFTAFEMNESCIVGMKKNFDAVGLKKVMIYNSDCMANYTANIADVIVTNPPYGKRIEPMDESFIRQLSAFMKHQCKGVSANLILPVDLAKSFGFKPKYKHSIYNGELACYSFGFEIFPPK